MTGQADDKPWWKSLRAKIVAGIVLIGTVVDIAGFVELVAPLKGPSRMLPNGSTRSGSPSGSRSSSPHC